MAIIETSLLEFDDDGDKDNPLRFPMIVGGSLRADLVAEELRAGEHLFPHDKINEIYRQLGSQATDECLADSDDQPLVGPTDGSELGTVEPEHTGQSGTLDAD